VRFAANLIPVIAGLLDAIATLLDDASGKAPSVDVVPASGAPRPHPEDRAERRQVTVMFSDLVG
jgi:hypothetical protein